MKHFLYETILKVINFIYAKAGIYSPEVLSGETVLYEDRILSGNRVLYQKEGKKYFAEELKKELRALWSKWVKYLYGRKDRKEYIYESEGKVYREVSGVLKEEGNIRNEIDKMEAGLSGMSNTIEELSQWVKDLSKDYIEGRIKDKSKPTVSECISRDKALTGLVSDYVGVNLIGILNVIHGRIREDVRELIYKYGSIDVYVTKRVSGEREHYVIKTETESGTGIYSEKTYDVADSRDMIFKIDEYIRGLLGNY